MQSFYAQINRYMRFLIGHIFCFEGVSVTQLDDGEFQVFAPNQAAMEEAKEKIDELLKEDVSKQIFLFWKLLYLSGTS